MPLPSRTAPGAPTNVELLPGMIWPYMSEPSVCTPGANQYVVLACRRFMPELSPAGTETAPGGGLVGPWARVVVSQTWPAVVEAGVVAVAVGVAVGEVGGVAVTVGTT